MNGTRNTGFVLSLALLASLVGHIAIHRHFERQTQSRVNSNESRLDSSFFNPPQQLEADRSQLAPKFLDRPRHVVPAVDSREEKPHEGTFRPTRPPAEVPSPADAVAVEDAPIERAAPEGENEIAVRDVIEHELSHATREEREIWFDELKSLPAGVVKELLQVRKQLRALPRVLGGIPDKFASTEPHSHQPHDLVAEPASQRIRFSSVDYVASIAALESAISQLRHNLTNAATPGYKRIRVMLSDSYGAMEADESPNIQGRTEGFLGEGCRTAPLRLDLKQGMLKKTSRPFDLAIDGDGFFVVQQGEREFLTRCGALTLDRDRRLCLAFTNDLAVLQPPVTIPENIREIQISSEGTITATNTGEPSITVIGRMELARVASPCRLSPVGETLLAANPGCGQVVKGTPAANGFGEIHQGFLERSNVHFEQEQEELEELTTILKSLPTYNPRPATANTPHQTPKR